MTNEQRVREELDVKLGRLHPDTVRRLLLEIILQEALFPDVNHVWSRKMALERVREVR